MARRQLAVVFLCGKKSAKGAYRHNSYHTVNTRWYICFLIKEANNKMPLIDPFSSIAQLYFQLRNSESFSHGFL